MNAEVNFLLRDALDKCYALICGRCGSDVNWFKEIGLNPLLTIKPWHAKCSGCGAINDYVKKYADPDDEDEE